MHAFEPEQVAHAVIPYFLRNLMKIERELKGLARHAASSSAGWSSSVWGHLERGTRALQPHHFMAAERVLEMGEEDLVRRLNAFIGKHPSIWIERLPSGEIEVCERTFTSPRPLRSGNIVNVDLNPVRPELYDALSAFSDAPDMVIEIATKLGFMTAIEIAELPPPAHPAGAPQDRDRLRREKLCRAIMALPAEKLGLLERVVDKFQRFSSSDLAYAYKHFSLSVSKL
ncbi:MAG: hypothetical protein PHU25_18190 [Deltaproteobacteria bacterium]|nr:hypothetical protein [Deltaproteobacteria bacterium]